MAHEPPGGEGEGGSFCLTRRLNGWDAGAFAWGFAEATLFFVIPDVLISLVALRDWRAGFRLTGSVPGRMWRFLLSAGVAALIGRALAQRPRTRLVLWGLFWIATYVGLARMIQATWGS